MSDRRGRQVQPELIELSVSEFVSLLNQTLEFAYPSVTVVGELANFRINRNRWVYFDLKDEEATVKFFGTVYQLPGPLEDGMLLKVLGQPRLHNLYGFSINVLSIQPAGEGSIKRAAQLLQAKLAKEGLFDESRKRFLPEAPSRIGLITSRQSAAYADFIKVLNARWPGVAVEVIDVQVQGEVAPDQIVAALEQLNSLADPPEVLVLVRGGGSPEDLAAFSTEQVTRAVAASRVPTLVAIGHEVDISLAEMAADQRASTPSNAAELLVPDRREVLQSLQATKQHLRQYSAKQLELARLSLKQEVMVMGQILERLLERCQNEISSQRQLLAALNPEAILRRGYAIVRSEGRAIRSVGSLKTGGIVNIRLADGKFDAGVQQIIKE